MIDTASIIDLHYIAHINYFSLTQITYHAYCQSWLECFGTKATQLRSMFSVNLLLFFQGYMRLHFK